MSKITNMFKMMKLLFYFQRTKKSFDWGLHLTFSIGSNGRAQCISIGLEKNKKTDKSLADWILSVE